MGSGSIIVKAASVFVYVLDRNGVAIHSKRSGIELIQHMKFGSREGRIDSDREDRVDGFAADFQIVDDVPAISEPDRVRSAGIAVLSPFLPTEPPAPAEDMPNAVSVPPEETSPAAQ